ncbi:UNVERIFIED_CONTAM: gatB [Trichonephila clavipes]
MPGVLPVLNAEVVDLAIRFGLGIDAYIDQASVFARKNYFYPDSPKGYQISQMDNPIVGLGHIDIQLEDGTVKRIGVTRAHLEEDAGKSIHDQFEGMSGIDLNRAGTPLLEIVSEPDMRSVEEAVAYIKAIHTLVRWLGISDGNMAEGSFRADCNVSLRRPGQPFGTRCELKNLNSFRFIEQAINVEIERQMEILEYGGEINQETRLFDPNKMETRSMRSKEEANDYRYFPDPDLLPVIISNEQIEAARAALPELPAARRERFIADFGVTEYDAHVLTLSREMADFYEAVVAAAGGAKQGKVSANWVMGEFSGALNKAGLDLADSPVSAEQLGGMIARIVDNTINAIGGNTVRHRRIALIRVARFIAPITFDYWIQILKRKDIKFSAKELKDAFYLAFGGVNRLGIFSRTFIEMLDVRDQHFDPQDMQTEQLEAEYREKLFGENGILKSALKS